MIVLWLYIFFAGGFTYGNRIEDSDESNLSKILYFFFCMLLGWFLLPIELGKAWSKDH